MSIAEKLVVAALCWTRLRIENTIGKLGSLESMGMIGGEYPNCEGWIQDPSGH